MRIYTVTMMTLLLSPYPKIEDYLFLTGKIRRHPTSSLAPSWMNYSIYATKKHAAVAAVVVMNAAAPLEASEDLHSY